MKIFRKENFKALDHAIYRTFENPFASTTFDSSKPIQFFVGREDEIAKILQIIQFVLNEAQSKAITLEGPGGCGKSTLFGYLSQIMKEGKITDYPSFLINLNIFSIYSTYFMSPVQADSFHRFLTPIFEGLEESDHSFLEYIAFLFLTKLFVVFDKNPEKQMELGRLI